MTAAYEYKETLLKIDNICLDFGDRPILRNVCAEIKDIVRPGCTQGQVVGLLGPSGIGKTQLFKIIAGLQEPTAGRVLINCDGPLEKGLHPVTRGQVGVV